MPVNVLDALSIYSTLIDAQSQKPAGDSLPLGIFHIQQQSWIQKSIDADKQGADLIPEIGSLPMRLFRSG
jgi:hypothetical protein